MIQSRFAEIRILGMSGGSCVYMRARLTAQGAVPRRDSQNRPLPRSGTRGDGSQSGLAPASRVQCASGLSLEVAMRTGCRADVPAARAIPIPPSLAVALALAALCGALACGGEAPDSAVAEDPLEAEGATSPRGAGPSFRGPKWWRSSGAPPAPPQ